MKILELILRFVLVRGTLCGRGGLSAEAVDHRGWRQEAARALLELCTATRASHVQLLADHALQDAALSTDIQRRFFGSMIPLEKYSISTKTDIEQVEETGVAGRRLLLIVVKRGSGGFAGISKAIHLEASRVAVLEFHQQARATVWSTQASSKWPRSLFPVNEWRSESGLRLFPPLPESRLVFRSLAGKNLRVPVLHKPPWHFVERRNSSLMVLGGRDHQLLRELSTRMNFRVISVSFTYLDPPERSQGSSPRAPSSNVSNPAIPPAQGGGDVLSLIRRRVDLFLGDAAVTFERSLGVDFSFFTLADSGAFVTRAPLPLSEALAIVRPFHWQVWLAVGVAALLACPALFLAQSLARQQESSLGDCAWTTVAIFLKQSYGRMAAARSHKARLLLVLLSLSATYVIGDLYCANLTSLLARPGRERPVRTLEGLERAVAARRYELLVERRSSAMDFLRHGPREARRLWEHMQHQPRGALVTSVERGVALVGSRPGLALLAGRETLHFETIRFGERRFHLSDPLFTRYSAVALQQGCPYLPVLDSILQRLFEAGVLDRMTALEYARLGGQQRPQVEDLEQSSPLQPQTARPLTLQSLQGAFLLLACGVALAGLVLILEGAWSRCSAPQRPRGARDTWYRPRQWRRRTWRLWLALHRELEDAAAPQIH